jgi:hypothetical protein
MRWPAVLVTLPMMGPLEQEFTHLPLHHARVTAISTFQVDFAGHFIEKN